VPSSNCSGQPVAPYSMHNAGVPERGRQTLTSGGVKNAPYSMRIRAGYL